MSFHSSKTIAAAGTQEPLVATSVTLPTERFCARVTITAKPANTGYVYVGESDVSSTVFAFRLAASESVTLGMGETRGNSIDLATVYIDTSVNDEGVDFYAEQI